MNQDTLFSLSLDWLQKYYYRLVTIKILIGSIIYVLIIRAAFKMLGSQMYCKIFRQLCLLYKYLTVYCI